MEINDNKLDQKNIKECYWRVRNEKSGGMGKGERLVFGKATAMKQRQERRIHEAGSLSKNKDIKNE